jgi:hypothetical protein
MPADDGRPCFRLDWTETALLLNEFSGCSQPPLNRSWFACYRGSAPRHHEFEKGASKMTVTLLLNIFFALGIVVALAVVCRIPYRLVSVERLEERAAPATTAAPA